MTRIEENLLDITVFNDLSAVHDADAVGNVGNNAQVMSDVQRGEPKFLLQITDQLQDLSLNGNVQRSRRLVTDQDFRMAGQSDRNDDTLAHATGVLERELIKAVGRVLDTDALHDFNGLFFCFRLRDALMLLNDLGDLRTDCADRIQRCHRILEDRGYLGTADTFPVLIGLQLCQILSMEHDRTIGNHTVGAVR